MNQKKKRLFTGLQPSGSLHIGNYFGALKPFVDTYQDYESFLCAVDYHALTTVRDADTLAQQTRSVIIDYLAAGVDPEHATIFKQSDVPEHTELAWILDCIVPTGLLERGHAYKDKVSRGKEATAGLFTYPVLMTADIVLYDSDVVPVGEDQRQHLEYARDIAARFNTTFGDTFKLPQEQIIEHVATVPGTDGQKMSKSYDNTIPLFGSKDEITRAVMSIVTDSTGERPEHVYAIHSLFKSTAEIDPLYEEHRGNYKALKEALIEDIEAFIAPMRERRAAYEADPERVDRIIKEGGERARSIVGIKMQDVRKKIGVAS